jgi:hypothetical protein
MAQYVNTNYGIPDVTEAFNSMSAFATQLTNSADNLANSLANYSPIYFQPNFTPSDLDTNLNLRDTGELSSVTLPTINEFDPPTDYQLNLPTIDLTNIQFPEYNIAEPTFNSPTKPNALQISAPDKPTIDLDKQFPDDPVINLPSAPTLQSFSLPSLDSISLPSFTGNLPSLSNIDIPTATLDYNEQPYDDTLLDCIKIELKNRLTQSTGLNPVVEQAIWDRGRDREHTAVLSAENDLLKERGQLGLSRPSGALQSALDAVRQEAQSKLIELSREIMIKQAELEQENFKFSMQQAIALEEILIREYSAVQLRTLDVAKHKFQMALEVFKAQVSRYELEVDLVKTETIVFETKLKAELSKLDKFKAEIEAQKLISDINKETINVYLAQLEGVKSTVELYKTRVGAVTEQLRAEGLKIQSYSADVDAYKSLIQSKSEEFKAYSEEMRGELVKSQVFDSKVKAYTSRVQAYSQMVDVEAKKADIQITGEKLKSDTFAVKMDAYLKRIQAEQSKIQLYLDKYKTELQKYLADISYNTAASELEMKVVDTSLRQYELNTNLSLKAAEIHAQSIRSGNAVQVEALKGAGSIYAQLAASSLNAVNVNMSSNQGVNQSLNESYNISG